MTLSPSPRSATIRREAETVDRIRPVGIVVRPVERLLRAVHRMGSAAQKRASRPLPAQRRDERDPVMIPPPPLRRIPVARGLRLRHHTGGGAVEKVIPPLFRRRPLIVEPGRLPVQHETLEALLPEIPVAEHRPGQLLPQLVPEDLQRETLVNPVEDERRRLIGPVPEVPPFEEFSQDLGIRVAKKRLRHDGRDPPGHDVRVVPLERPVVVDRLLPRPVQDLGRDAGSGRRGRRARCSSRGSRCGRS